MIQILNILSQTNGTLSTILVIIFIFIVTTIVVKIQRTLMENAFKHSTKLLKVEPTRYNFLKHFLSALIYFIGLSFIIYTIPSLRAFSVSILAGAGVLAVIIGFASQQALSNIISGIFIVIFRPFRVGDKIKIGTDVSGIVEDINLRHSVIRTYENKRIIIPNSIISNEKIENANLGDEKVCKFVEFGISYDSSVKKAKKIMQEEAEKNPLIFDNRSEEEKKNKEPIVTVRVIGFTDSSVVIRAWAWAKDPFSAFKMGCDLYESIKERFDKEGIEIPFPHRTIVYKKEKRTRT